MRDIHFAVDPNSTSKKQVSCPVILNNSILWLSHITVMTIWFDDNSSNEKFKIVLQALELIQELQKHYPIKRCPLRVRAAAPEEQVPVLLEKLSEWKATVISQEGTAAQLSVVSSLFLS
jgi:hypothetical protein